MDVRKPKLITNWRELLKEYAIIVLGVLTALFAEQAVQSIEWHQKVDAAIADMDNELSAGDGPQAYARMAMHDCVSVATRRLPRGRRTRRSCAEAATLSTASGCRGGPTILLAREAATASDVASHMPHDRMLQYRIAYEVVPDMQRLADKELAELGHLAGPSATGGPIETSEKLAAS